MLRRESSKFDLFSSMIIGEECRSEICFLFSILDGKYNDHLLHLASRISFLLACTMHTAYITLYTTHYLAHCTRQQLGKLRRRQSKNTTALFSVLWLQTKCPPSDRRHQSISVAHRLSCILRPQRQESSQQNASDNVVCQRVIVYDAQALVEWGCVHTVTERMDWLLESWYLRYGNYESKNESIMAAAVTFDKWR